MIDFHPQLVEALESVLPTYYELTLTPVGTPCISYMEVNNYTTTKGDNIEYSHVQYQVKVWGIDIAELQKYSQLIDKALRPLGFKRTQTNELYDRNSAMIQKILIYDGLGFENSF